MGTSATLTRPASHVALHALPMEGMRNSRRVEIRPLHMPSQSRVGADDCHPRGGHVGCAGTQDAGKCRQSQALILPHRPSPTNGKPQTPPPQKKQGLPYPPPPIPIHIWKPREKGFLDMYSSGGRGVGALHIQLLKVERWRVRDVQPTLTDAGQDFEPVLVTFSGFQPRVPLQP